MGLRGVVSVGVALVMFCVPLEADASIGSFIGSAVTDVGITESAATPLDLETGGLSALAALAVGVGMAAVTPNASQLMGTNAYNTNLGKDAWNWATNEASSLGSWISQTWNSTSGGTVQLTNSAASALNSFYQSEVGSLGWYQGAQLVGSPSTDSGSMYGPSAVEMGTYDNFPEATTDFESWAKQNHPSWQYLLEWSAGSYTYYLLSNEPVSSVALASSTAANEETYFYMPVGTSWVQDTAVNNSSPAEFLSSTSSTPGNLTVNTMGSSGYESQLPSGNGITVSLWPLTGYLPTTPPAINNSGLFAPGSTVYLPPVAQTPGGDIGVPTPTLDSNGNVGLTADGNTLVNPSTGVSTTVGNTLTSSQGVQVQSDLGIGAGAVTTSWLEALVSPIVTPYQNLFKPINDLISAFQNGWSTGSKSAPVIYLPDLIDSSAVISSDNTIQINFGQWSNLMSQLKGWIGAVVWGFAGVMSIRRLIKMFEKW